VKFIPAIDLKDNNCVRLIQGKEEKLTIFNRDPVEQAKFFENNGCERIHVVDLDGAFGRPEINKKTILDIRQNTNIPIELGGGLNKINDISFWINQGIDFLIIGSLAIKEKDLVIDISNKFKNKIYVSLDILKGRVMIKGWLEESKISLENIFNIYNSSSIKGFVLTDVSRDGTLNGLNISLIKTLVSKTNKNVIVGGGLSNYSDLKIIKNYSIDNTNLEGVIAGKSFYSGNIEISKALNLLKSKYIQV
jgi:phosphoribosylformimino-5-aminoimidazole carboxamide ribotide isomerase